MSGCILCGKSLGGMCDPWEWHTSMHQDCHIDLINKHRKDRYQRDTWRRSHRYQMRNDTEYAKDMRRMRKIWRDNA